MTKVELVNKFCMFCVKIPRKDCLLKILSIIAHWVSDRPECSYFEDILKLELLLHVCSLFKTVLYIVDKLSPYLKHLAWLDV